jgi:hypothetical protein
VAGQTAVTLQFFSPIKVRGARLPQLTQGQRFQVEAIAEGREAARGVDKYLMSTTNLPHSQFLK